MKLKVGHVLTSILTFLFGVLVAGLINSSFTSPKLSQPNAPIPILSNSSTEAEQHGYGYFEGNSSVPFVAEQEPTIEQFKKLVTCKDKTISLVWKQLTHGTEFWNDILPSFKHHDCAAMFEVTRLDLNGDGVKEIKIRGQYGNHCGGTGNCEEWVFGYHKKSRTYKLILNSWSERFYVLRGNRNGYRDVYITIHDSASSSYHMVYKFSRTRYREAKCWYDEYSLDGSHFSESCAKKLRYESESTRP